MLKHFIKESLVGITVDEFIDAKNALHSLQQHNRIISEDEEENLMNVEEKNELDKYLDIPSAYKRRKIMREEIDFYIDYSEHFSTGDSLSSVWLHLKPIFPKTFELARKYLCCQSTSCESERIFSDNNVY